MVPTHRAHYEAFCLCPPCHHCVLQEFMLRLTQHQGKVGNVLQEGNQLLSAGNVKLSKAEETEIRAQMALLNNRWEELRVRAMDRQAR